MKRLFGVFLVLFFATLVFVQPASASTEDFKISYFVVDYYLSKDSDGRSVLKTVEKITAQFPEYDQNHGIDRYLIKKYDNHSTSLSLVSVTDGEGNPIDYLTPNNRKDPDVLFLRIGDSNTYVHGKKTYVITYTQRDVTKYFSNTNDDEFYWDTNGTDSKQTFGMVSANLHLDSSVANDFTGNMSCYVGVQGSSDKCSISRFNSGLIIAMTYNLKSYENMTIAVGFNPHTFAEYKKTSGEIIKERVMIAITAANLLFLVLIIVLRLVKVKGSPSKVAIVAEYLPPKGVDVVTASIIVRKPKKWFAATCVDLAVRHNIKIIESKNEASPNKPEYSLEFLSAKGLNKNEIGIIEAMFGENPKVGATYKFSKFNQIDTVAGKIYKEFWRLKKQVEKGEYYVNLKSVKRKMSALATCSLIATLIFYMLINVYGEKLYFTVNGFCFILSVTISQFVVWAFSASGRELRDYLKGLKLYIKVAEEDRIKILQSPRGAEKTPIDVNDTKYLVNLYERVLPYAILFGNEKEWAIVLGKYYEAQGANPEWYGGNNIMNMAFTNAMVSSFSRAARGSISAYGLGGSSSTGGSGGGGFSGGGGGGGGVGGW